MVSKTSKQLAADISQISSLEGHSISIVSDEDEAPEVDKCALLLLSSTPKTGYVPEIIVVIIMMVISNPTYYSHLSSLARRCMDEIDADVAIISETEDKILTSIV